MLREDLSMLKTIAVLAAAAVLTGCASTPGQYGTRCVPDVDLQGRDQNKYQQDLAECQTLAQQRGDTAQQALAGAVGAALIGAILALVA